MRRLSAAGDCAYPVAVVMTFFFPRGSRSRKVLMVGVATISLLATFITAPESSSARHRYRVRSTELADGLIYTRILDHKGPRPKRIKILEVDPATSLSVDVTLAGDKISGLQRTSSISSDEGALAAVNGTFYLPSGRPVGVFSEDADFKTTPLVSGNAVALTPDEQQTFIGRPTTRVTLYRPFTEQTHKVNEWNAGDPLSGQIGGYSVAGGSAARPPRDACSARLQPSSDVMWSASGVGYEGDYVVEKIKCDSSRLRRGGGVVLSTPDDGNKKANLISTLYPNETTRLSFSVGWPQVFDAMAGNPVLVENGENIGYKCDSSFCKKQPRTGIGVTAENKILLVTVDGRQKRYSVGMNLFQFGRLFQSLGAVYALNLDGGGSTTMVVDGEVKNRPSDGSERSVGSAVLVLPGPDPDEPVPQPYSSPTTAPPPPPLPSPTPTDVPGIPGLPETAPRTNVIDGFAVAGMTVTSVLTDPGSTGGLLDAIRAGDVGSRSDMPASLRWALRVFRSR